MLRTWLIIGSFPKNCVLLPSSDPPEKAKYVRLTTHLDATLLGSCLQLAHAKSFCSGPPEPPLSFPLARCPPWHLHPTQVMAADSFVVGNQWFVLIRLVCMCFHTRQLNASRRQARWWAEWDEKEVNVPRVLGNMEVTGDLGDLVISRESWDKSHVWVNWIVNKGYENWHNKHRQIFHEHFTQRKKDNLHRKGLKNAGIFLLFVFLVQPLIRAWFYRSCQQEWRSWWEKNPSVFLIKCELKLLAENEREASW